MPITGQGWELHVERLGVQQHSGNKRTYSDYRVFRNGTAIPALAGNICECIGPGDNLHEGSGTRIAAGRYGLSTQFGKYRTIGYSEDLAHEATPHMPGILVEGTVHRVGILIHPGHRPKLYLSSIGCFNPTRPLRNADSMDFFESRARVIALIDDLKDFAPASFRRETNTPIANAFVVVDGEPMNPLPDPPDV